MDKLKQQIEQRLKANVLIDKCAHCSSIIFRDAWCTQDRVIRFTSPFFRQLFPYVESEKGPWKTGDAVMYEVTNAVNSLEIRCLFCPEMLQPMTSDEGRRLCKTCGVSETSSETVSMKTWHLSSGGDINRLFDAFDAFLSDDLPGFESNIRKRLATDTPSVFREGSEKTVTSNEYERNSKAREACLAAHGTACTVCGIDFGKDYGPEFAGKIEVHHTVPLSQIGTEYVVDPVRDLVPVCPNCHTALHSKKDGVYTIEEMRKLRNR